MNSKDWYCPTCKQDVDGHNVTFQETHDKKDGGCGDRVYPNERNLYAIVSEDAAAIVTLSAENARLREALQNIVDYAELTVVNQALPTTSRTYIDWICHIARAALA